VMAKFKRF